MSNGTDMALISELVARERLFRARHNPEIRDCYYADATVATSWQQGPLSTFIGAESKEVDPRFVIVGSVSTPVVHLNGDKAYVELPTTTHMRMMVNGTLAELESYRRLIYRVERRDTKWKISRLTSINESDNLRPVIVGQDLQEQAKQIQQLSQSTNMMLIWIAGISLLVGGIGVMNIMLVSVTERTSEIGLKKAIGAGKGAILGQFLTEAVVLTSLGGLVGVLVGVILSKVISMLNGTPTAISPAAAILAVLFSMAIGIIFGMLPSYKAANLNPIDALRHE